MWVMVVLFVATSGPMAGAVLAEMAPRRYISESECEMAAESIVTPGSHATIKCLPEAAAKRLLESLHHEQ
jgi:hypothetical protein